MKKILFVCVENAGRSKMAEAFLKKYSQKNLQAYSAGTNPAGTVNPVVLVAMKEIGIDLQETKPVFLTKEMITDSTVTVNMGCIDKESCPALFVKNVLDWGIEDPKGKDIEQVRIIRDQIEDKVKKLVETLEGNSLA